ncbi:MAG: hypothetical protein KC502_05590 [Myxococcales bacterium]|nr:hypothetical protein [Myxococcales bacterium]
MPTSSVPGALRKWFVVHFWADILFALPLFVAPQAVLSLVGWQQVDPITARLVAAALFGIGIESLLGRNADAESFRTMLNLKVIWSATASVGIAWSIAEGAHGRPPFAWLVLGIFVVFHLLWVYWRLRMRQDAA